MYIYKIHFSGRLKDSTVKFLPEITEIEIRERNLSPSPLNARINFNCALDYLASSFRKYK